MKKAILFDPKLLAEVERESPAVYKKFCISPFARIEFADYGTSDIPMYMPKHQLYLLETLIKKEDNYSLMIEFFQAGWVMGMSELYGNNHCISKNPLRKEIGKIEIMMAACAYPYYTIDTLMGKESVLVKDDIVYNAFTYKEGQCFEAWKLILKCHQYFNGSFAKMEAKLKDFKHSKLTGFNIHAN